MRRTFIALAIAGSLVAGSFAYAQEAANTDDGTAAQQSQTYPIEELGGCESREACKTYCDSGENGIACLDYAEKHGLMSGEEVAKARLLLKEHEGPGGCQGHAACRAYCSDPANAEVCTRYAEEHGLAAPGRSNDQASVSAKIVQVIQEKGGPGGCSSLGACKAYCDDSSHHDECQKFASDNGLTPPERRGDGAARSRDFAGGERRDFKPQEQRPQMEEGKAAQVLAQKGGPGGCTSMDSCRAYCDEDAHRAECLKFAVENGLMSQEEAERAEQLADEEGPGGCKGMACRDYCEDEAHADECLSYAEEHGLMSEDEVKRARTFIGKPGPGGCMGEACKTYCEDRSHAQECMQFAVDNGLMSQEDANERRSMGTEGGPGGCTGDECESYCKDPAHQRECMEFAREHGIEREGDDDDGPPPGQFQGPGGCTSEAECMAFCRENPKVCEDFAPQGGAGRPGTGPYRGSDDGGANMPNRRECDSREECERMYQGTQYGPPPMGGEERGQYGPPPYDDRGGSMPGGPMPYGAPQYDGGGGMPGYGGPTSLTPGARFTAAVYALVLDLVGSR